MTSNRDQTIGEIKRLVSLLEQKFEEIGDASKACAEALREGNTVFFCGNGGSCSQSQHLAAELIGRLEGERKAFSAIALTADTAALTCIANDFGYENVFGRQLEGLARKGDVLVALSTSGSSKNVVNACKTAKAHGLVTIGLTGINGDTLRQNTDINITVESTSAARIQEQHLILGHILCGMIEDELKGVSI